MTVNLSLISERSERLLGLSLNSTSLVFSEAPMKSKIEQKKFYQDKTENGQKQVQKQTAMGHIENAKITSTSLGYEDHGILTCWLQLEYRAGGQGFGGYGLDAPPLVRFGNSREPSIVAGFFIARILDTVGVRDWKDLAGKHVRVRKPDEWGMIEAIGHITEDKWFSPKAELQKLLPGS